jgi:hypothetical protein
MRKMCVENSPPVIVFGVDRLCAIGKNVKMPVNFRERSDGGRDVGGVAIGEELCRAMRI